MNEISNNVFNEIIAALDSQSLANETPIQIFETFTMSVLNKKRIT